MIKSPYSNDPLGSLITGTSAQNGRPVVRSGSVNTSGNAFIIYGVVPSELSTKKRKTPNFVRYIECENNS